MKYALLTVLTSKVTFTRSTNQLKQRAYTALLKAAQAFVT